MSTRDTLLQAATKLMLQRGFVATTVEQICTEAGTTKGAFFHHFKTKDELGIATLDRYAERIFAKFRTIAEGEQDPVSRVFEYIDGLSDIGYEADRPPACLLAIKTLELGTVNEIFRERCERYFSTWTHDFEALLQAAFDERSRSVPESRSAEDLATEFISVFEGSLLMARARKDPSLIRDNLQQYKGYLSFCLGDQSAVH